MKNEVLPPWKQIGGEEWLFSFHILRLNASSSANEIEQMKLSLKKKNQRDLDIKYSVTLIRQF